MLTDFIFVKKIKMVIIIKFVLGDTINYKYFQEQIKNNIIYLDSGMYETNPRNYSHFRSGSSTWYDLIIEEF